VPIIDKNQRFTRLADQMKRLGSLPVQFGPAGCHCRMTANGKIVKPFFFVDLMKFLF
jgi:hypothetical protein